jgi:hypothetical protein
LDLELDGISRICFSYFFVVWNSHFILIFVLYVYIGVVGSQCKSARQKSPADCWLLSGPLPSSLTIPLLLHIHHCRCKSVISATIDTVVHSHCWLTFVPVVVPIYYRRLHHCSYSLNAQSCCCLSHSTLFCSCRCALYEPMYSGGVNHVVPIGSSCSKKADDFDG